MAAGVTSLRLTYWSSFPHPRWYVRSTGDSPFRMCFEECIDTCAMPMLGKSLLPPVQMMRKLSWPTSKWPRPSNKALPRAPRPPSIFSTKALGGFHMLPNGHTPKWPVGIESWSTCAGLAGGDEKQGWGICERFLLWGGLDSVFQ